MFKALDKVNYDQLQLNEHQKKFEFSKFQPESLTDLACITLNWNTDILEEEINGLPVHLTPRLLQTAIVNEQYSAWSTIIANWPFETLR